MKFNIFLSLLTFLMVAGCSVSETPEEQRIDILAYLEENNLDAQETDSGIFYIIEEEGTGDRPDLSSDVTVHYEGRLLKNDRVFDSSYERGQPSTFPLTGVITGWKEGIPLFKEGGKGTLIIPSRLAYGGQARSNIPAYSILIFDIELIEVD